MDADKLHIALIQTHLLWENPEANRIALTEKINAITTKVDVIILPEMFTTGFTMQPEHINVLEGKKTLEWMQSHAKKKQVAVVGSIIFQEGKKFFNRLFFVYPTGEVQSYDKKHTFTLAGEHKVFEAGTKKLLVNFKGFKICPLICYDLRFPVWARNIEDYDVLIYVANWPKPRIKAWDALLKARAIENMSYCIGVNRIGIDGLGYEYTGNSAVYNVLGEQQVFSNKQEILYATLTKQHIRYNRDKLKFLEDRDQFNFV